MRVYRTNRRKVVFTPLSSGIYKFPQSTTIVGSHTTTTKQLTQQNKNFLEQLGLKVLL